MHVGITEDCHKLIKVVFYDSVDNLIPHAIGNLNAFVYHNVDVLSV